MKIKINEHQINPSCTACVCHKGAKTICLKGRNVEEKKKLVVFTDHPDYFADHAGRPYSLDVRRMLDWLFLRMSVEPENVAYEYTLRCYPEKLLPSTKADRAVCIEECAEYRFATIAKLRPKVIVALGTVSLEAFTGRTKIGDFVERKIRAWEPVVRDFTEDIWIGYSINYILLAPSDTPSVFRTLYMAAKEAGLKPKIDSTVPAFQWKELHH